MSGAEAPPASDLLLYQTEDGRTRVECRFEAETLWLTQIQMAELFQTTVQNISLHLQLIFQEQELIPEATIKSYLIVRSEGRRRVSRAVQHYSLPAILAVGFRVRGARGTQFRQWATPRLEEYLVKGFIMDDARLRNPPGPTQRARLFRRTAGTHPRYPRQRAAHLPAGAGDYRAGHRPHPRRGRNAGGVPGRAEQVAFCGNRPNRPRTDRQELPECRRNAELNRIVVMVLDFAEGQARRRKQIFLNDWKTRLDDFLRFNERAVLPHGGRVNRGDADRKATDEYERFATRRRAALEEEGE